MDNILLLRWGGLGDLLVVLPSIQLIRKTFPDARLTLVCQKKYGEVIAKAGVVDTLVDGDSPQLLPLFAACTQETLLYKDWFLTFGLVVGWVSGEKKKGLETNLENASLGRCHLIYYDERSQKQMSVFFFRKTAQALDRDDISFEECATLGFDLGRRGKDLTLIKKEEGKAPGKYVIVHPGSGSKEKCWPLPQFLAILSRLAEMGVEGILVTGEAETRMRPVLEKTILPQGWSWLHLPPVLELCRLLKEAALYIGNDSGVTHLAATCGTKVLALFRKGREEIWRPIGQTKTLCADRVEDIDPEEVWQEISRLLALDRP